MPVFSLQWTKRCIINVGIFAAIHTKPIWKQGELWLADLGQLVSLILAKIYFKGKRYFGID